MVAIYNVEDEFNQNPKTLGDWVKNFRVKRMQMKRKLRSGGNLRVCAILSTALMSAESELRRKQQERFQKWLEFQTKIDKNYEFQPRDELHHHQKRTMADDECVNDQELINDHIAEESSKQSEEIAKLWKCELSDLDKFMRSISSKSNNINSSTNSDYQAKVYQTQPIEVTS